MKIALLTTLIGFLCAVLVAPFIIRLHTRMKFGQKILEIGPSWHLNKQNTPTMGGVIFILAALAALLLTRLNGEDSLSFLMLGFSLIFGGIGFIDDFAKIKKKQNQGLTALQKLALQSASALLFVTLLRSLGQIDTNLYIPFVKISMEIPWGIYLLFSVFVIVATVNAVNLTDGIDGLCTSVSLIVVVYFALVLWGINRSAAWYPLALAGGLIGFLLYNKNPARIFMGDTGSLFLGGAICTMAFAAKNPLIIACVGLIYIIETLSDIIQVAYFKLTGGKRVFKMAPIHHHFEKSGWGEKKIVAVFSFITLVMCAVAYFLG